MNHKNTIEINGKLYDAKSGALLNSSPATFHPSQSIDGVVKSQPQSKPKTNHPNKSRSVHNPRKRRNTQKSQTLMRHVVKKPVSSQPKNEVSSFSRKQHDTTVSKSPYIRRFSHQPARPTVRNEHVEVAHPPEDNHAHLSHKKSAEHTHHQVAHKKEHKQSVEDIFQKAIADAPTKRKKTKKELSRAQKIGRTVSMASVFVLLFGFIAYMNFADLQIKLASTQAGFDASLPNYTVAGFNMDRSLDTEPGKVSISFTSNTDNRSYTVDEEVSRWNSTALQENFLSARNISYQTTQDAGKTIFLYDEGNATWVNGGIWYTVSSDSLSTDQLVKIASSL